MGHSHHHHQPVRGKYLLLTILLNVAITMAQIVGGLLSGSMALLSDAAHNFSDVLALIFSWVAARLSGRERTLKQTFGYKRAGIFAAFINSATLMIIATILIREAIGRFVNPQSIDGMIVIWLALLGMILNGLSALLLKRDAQSDINMRSAYLHLFTDTLTSVAVLLGGVAIQFLGWSWVDGILTIAISLYLIYSSWSIFYSTVRIFMQFAPSQISVEEIAARFEKIEGVKNIHHVHLWMLDDHEVMLEAHVDLDADYPISYFENVIDQAALMLEQYHIHHFILQPEWRRCDEKSLINKMEK